MKSAIREGDFKLYKNYPTHDYSLYRLYRGGQRDDLEETNDLAADPQYAPVLKRLSENLERHLIENQVEGPYRNPAYTNKTKPSAQIQTVTFQADRREAVVTLGAGPAIQTAYVIYREAPAANNKKRGAKNRPSGGKAAMDVRVGVKIPATIMSSGKSVSARIPEGIAAYCFLLIDENQYQTFSDIQVVR